jgi:acyl carrier protein
MSSVQTLDKEDLRETVAEVLDIDEEELTDEAHFVDDLEVDSLMVLEVMVVIERKYGVKLEQAELKQVATLDSAYLLLTEKLRQSS